MNITQIILQIIFSLIIIIVGFFSGKWLCMIAPDEMKKAKSWAKLLLKVFLSLILIPILSILIIGWKNALFVVEFLIFLSVMMIGIMYCKDIEVK